MKKEPFEKWQRHTLPPVTAVPSALVGLTSLFGMERGDPHRNSHHKIFNMFEILKIDLITFTSSRLLESYG